MAVAADDTMLALLCRLSLGLVTLDPDSRILSRNDVAAALLIERDGVTVQRGRIVASRADAAPALAGLLARACAGTVRAAGGTIEVQRRSPRRPLAVIVVALGAPSGPAHARAPAALVLLSDPERPPPRPERALARRYGLTPSEAEVALLVLGGAHIEDVARARKTSLHTARTQMKHLMGKVGVQSQLDLVRVLLAGPPDEPAMADAGDIPSASDTVLHLAHAFTKVAR